MHQLAVLYSPLLCAYSQRVQKLRAEFPTAELQQLKGSFGHSLGIDVLECVPASALQLHQLTQELHSLQRDRDLAVGAAGDGRLAEQEAMLQRLAEEVRNRGNGCNGCNRCNGLTGGGGGAPIIERPTLDACCIRFRLMVP